MVVISSSSATPAIGAMDESPQIPLGGSPKSCVPQPKSASSVGRATASVAFDSMTLFLVRHASAGHRSNADPDDLSRRLDDYGKAQATLLIEHLEDFEIAQILTSSAVRCRETVEPIAAHRGLEVVDHPALLEGSSTAKTMDLIRGVSDQHTLLCSHGDIIPDVIRVLEVGGTRIQGQRRFAKGSIWEIDCVGGRFTDARYTEVTPAVS